MGRTEGTHYTYKVVFVGYRIENSGGVIVRYRYDNIDTIIYTRYFLNKYRTGNIMVI